MSPSSDEPRPPASPAGKPTLEMLLRVKRGERPDADFWTDFERGFRQKQLAAIIEPRPWWLGFAILGRRLAPLGLPASAGAAALLAVMVLRTESPFAANTTPVEFSPSIANVVRDAASISRPSGSISDLTPEISSQAVDASESRAQDVLAAPAATPPVPAIATAVIPPTEVHVAAALLEFPPAIAANPTPSQATIAQNLATVRAEEPDLIAASAPAFASLDKTRAVLDLASDVAETRDAEGADRILNPRQARILAMVDTVAQGNDLASVRERMVHRLAHDDTTYGSSSRLGVGGDRFSLSF